MPCAISFLWQSTPGVGVPCTQKIGSSLLGAQSYWESCRTQRQYRADRLAGKALITGGLRLGRSKVMRSLRHYLRAHSQGHRPPEGERRRKRSVQRSSLRGQKRAIVNQTKIWNCSKGNIGKTPERPGGAHLGFPERIYTTLNWTELNWTQPWVSQIIALHALPADRNSTPLGA